MGVGASQLSWGVGRRLEFIEFRLYWEGGINRGDIMEKFRISMPQASNDLSQYQELAPGNMEYNKSTKRYFATTGFSPRFLKPDSDQFLSQLREVVTHAVPLEETWLSKMPQCDALPLLERTVDVTFLRKLVEAVRNEHAMKILYQSMNPKHPDPKWRGISPHAFGHDGFRWHVRAFCHIDSTFKDFLLSRCLDFRSAGEALRKPSDDKDWMGLVDIELKPNPKLSRSQQSIISRDYGMKDGKLTLRIRRPLLFYFEKQLRIEIAEALDRPQEAPLVIGSKRMVDRKGSEE